MTRKKLILIITGSVLFVIFITTAVILANPSPEPKDVDNTTTSKDAGQNKSTDTNNSEEQSNHSEITMHGDHDELMPQETTDAIFLNAQQAAEAYVSQPMDEDTSTRRERLRQYFAPASKVITAKPPVTNASFTTSKTTTLQTDWYDLGGKKMGVIVYMNVGVNTGFNEYEEKQSWVVELIKYHNNWLANKIMKSDMPYIEGVNG